MVKIFDYDFFEINKKKFKVFSATGIGTRSLQNFVNGIHLHFGTYLKT